MTDPVYTLSSYLGVAEVGKRVGNLVGSNMFVWNTVGTAANAKDPVVKFYDVQRTIIFAALAIACNYRCLHIPSLTLP